MRVEISEKGPNDFLVSRARKIPMSIDVFVETICWSEINGRLYKWRSWRQDFSGVYFSTEEERECSGLKKE